MAVDVPVLTEPAVIFELNVAAPASEKSRVRAVIPEPPSLPLNNISLSCTLDSMTKLLLEFSNKP